MPTWVEEVLKQVPVGAAALIGWWQFLLARRDKRVAEANEAEAKRTQATAEAEMQAIRRRALTSAPYFEPTQQSAMLYQFPDKVSGEMRIVSLRTGRLIDLTTDQVPEAFPKGATVMLVVDNKGQGAVEEVLDLDGVPVALHESRHARSLGALLIEYPYDPAMRGKIQTLTMRFLTRDGAREVHKYETKHGMRWLRRIDPA